MDTIADSVPLVEILPRFCSALDLSHGAPGMYTKSSAIAEIIGVPTSVVVTWLRDNTQPTGDRRAKLLLLLSIFGYEAKERALLSAKMKTFSDIISTVVDIEKASTEVNTRDKNILSWIRGEVTPKITDEISSFLEKYEPIKDEKVRRWKKNLQSAGLLQIDSITSEQSLGVVDEKTSKPMTSATLPDEVIVSAAEMVSAMKPLSDLLLSTSSTPEMRERFRTLAGQINIFALKNNLTRLCGETAFNKS